MSKLIDLTGQKFGKLTVLSLVGRRGHDTMWLCGCECGGEKIARSIHIRRGKTRSCGCILNRTGLEHPRTIDLTGQKFGKLTVLGPAKPQYWTCRCECGNITVVNGNNLRQGKLNSCRCSHLRKGELHPNWQGVGGLSGGYYASVKGKAKKRDILFAISKEEALQQFIKQNGKCVLTGVDLVMPIKRSIKGTASLDRIDSTKGYTPENIQWLHKDINKMKLDHLQSSFIEICQRVAEYAKKNMKIENPLPKDVPRHGGSFTFPRRACIDQMTHAEKIIYEAVGEVEKLGADPLLTDAVILLGDARAKVADWLEGGTRL